MSAGDGLLAFVATSAYVLSAVKFSNRDPLSTQTGMQAYLEIGLVAVSLITAVALAGRRGERPRPSAPALGFGAFAVLAMLSSVFSYWPALSIIKASMLLAILATTVLLCASRPPAEILRNFYWSALAVVVLGIGLKLFSGQPLFDVDEYSGRLRFTVFAWHWGSLADFVALAALVGRLIPKRPPWPCQLLLISVNLATCARTSNVTLILIMIAASLWAAGMTVRTVAAVASAAAAAALIAWIVVTTNVPVDRIPFERFYGDKMNLEEITTLNGRTGVWEESQSLVRSSLIFGYGLEGTRAAILREFEWAGHVHNAYLELLLSGGLAGLLVFVIGWGSAIVRGVQTTSPAKPHIVGLYVYMIFCGLTDPNLTLLQCLPVFLIVSADALTRPQPAAAGLVCRAAGQ
jgi:O-antigen ligase